MVNLNQINEALKRSFIKLKREMDRLKNDSKTQAEDISMIRQNLLEINVFKKRIENIETMLEKLSLSKEVSPVEKEEKRGFFSKLLFWRME
jgi:hypothetical protein